MIFVSVVWLLDLERLGIGLCYSAPSLCFEGIGVTLGNRHGHTRDRQSMRVPEIFGIIWR
jgi:hypothetical protein